MVKLFNVTHSDWQPSMVCPVGAIFRQFGHIRDTKKSSRSSKTNEDILNVMLTVEGNSHSTLIIRFQSSTKKQQKDYSSRNQFRDQIIL